MGTLVVFHAHPDDESISTGGSIARAVAEGHRVVLVVATNGDFGEIPDDLEHGETLVHRRQQEAVKSAAVLGIHRLEWLGYKDSGMTGWEQNADPESFLRADLDEAAERLAAILRDESADVVATNGDFGEIPDDLEHGETLVHRRQQEAVKSAAVLGIHRLEWLGYKDSGMTGWEQNADPESFLRADLDEAAERLAAILRDESADVVTTYDWHGNYGHPDHIKVHQVGHRAAELAGTPAVFEATMNRDHIVRMMTMVSELGSANADEPEQEFDPSGPADDGNPFGMSEEELTHAVDVTAFIAQKRASMKCHASQITDTSFFLQMPDEQFALAFGTEWFIRKGAPTGVRPGWLFE